MGASNTNLILCLCFFLCGISHFIDALLTILQHAIDYSVHAMSHGGDEFGGAELAYGAPR